MHITNGSCACSNSGKMDILHRFVQVAVKHFYRVVRGAARLFRQRTCASSWFQAWFKADVERVFRPSVHKILASLFERKVDKLRKGQRHETNGQKLFLQGQAFKTIFDRTKWWSLLFTELQIHYYFSKYIVVIVRTKLSATKTEARLNEHANIVIGTEAQRSLMNMSSDCTGVFASTSDPV